MINSLDLALDMHSRMQVKEFYVSTQVFLQVLRASRQDGRRGLLVLNASYNSFFFQYVHKVSWNEMLFINVSKSNLRDEESGISD